MITERHTIFSQGSKICTQQLPELVLSEEYLTGMKQIKLQSGDILHFKKGVKTNGTLVVSHLVENRTDSIHTMEQIFGIHETHKSGAITRSPRQKIEEVEKALQNGEIDLALVPAGTNLERPRNERLKIIDEVTTRIPLAHDPKHHDLIRMHIVGNGVIERVRKWWAQEESNL